MLDNFVVFFTYSIKSLWYDSEELARYSTNNAGEDDEREARRDSRKQA
jgi:hypothetical protein